MISINYNNNFNTSLVTDMIYMYMPIYTSNGDWSGDVNLVYSQKEVKPSFMENKNDGNLELMASAGPSYDSYIKKLDLSSFNTSNVTNMSGMFGYCTSLTSLDLSSFNTSNVTDMGFMFYICSSLTSLDLSSFNTSNVTNMREMFYGCSFLTTTINIMSAGVTSYTNMFYKAATSNGAQITVNYIVDASSLVDNMIATKSSSSNVVKGTQI